MSNLPWRRLLSPAGALLLALAASSCTSWRTVATGPGWRLYAQPDQELDPGAWRARLGPALKAVEAQFGPFEDPVDVHIVAGEADPAASTDIRLVPGVGHARVSGYHVRSSGSAFSREGIFLREAGMGTLVHELVHARFAELDVHLPLWFEEGVATFFGDGMEVGDGWVLDGLACWPLRELREARLGDEDLRRILALDPAGEVALEDDVLAHFLGWAIVFDLYRETGSLDWREWLETFDAREPVADARARMERSIERERTLEWLELGLSSEDPARRAATALGTWKLRSWHAMRILRRALAREQDPKARLSIGINLLASAGEMGGMGRRTWSTLLDAFQHSETDRPEEQQALRDLVRAYDWPWDDEAAQDALSRLGRHWRE